MGKHSIISYAGRAGKARSVDSWLSPIANALIILSILAHLSKTATRLAYRLTLLSHMAASRVVAGNEPDLEDPSSRKLRLKKTEKVGSQPDLSLPSFPNFATTLEGF
jgi:hypothetical protein